MSKKTERIPLRDGIDPVAAAQLEAAAGVALPPPVGQPSEDANPNEPEHEGAWHALDAVALKALENAPANGPEHEERTLKVALCTAGPARSAITQEEAHRQAAVDLAEYIAKVVHETHPGNAGLLQECQYFHALLMRGCRRVVPMRPDILAKLISDLRATAPTPR